MSNENWITINITRDRSRNPGPSIFGKGIVYTHDRPSLIDKFNIAAKNSPTGSLNMTPSSGLHQLAQIVLYGNDINHCHTLSTTTGLTDSVGSNNGVGNNNTIKDDKD